MIRPENKKAFELGSEKGIELRGSSND